MELIIQDQYDKRHKQSTIPTALPKTKKQNRNQSKKYKEDEIEKTQTTRVKTTTIKARKRLRILQTTKWDTSPQLPGKNG